jgi:uncharacterized protein with HEPN domain
VSREPLQYLEGICESCSLILSFTEGIAYERFRADRMRVDAEYLGARVFRGRHGNSLVGFNG